MKRETPIVRAILQALQLRGLLAWRVNSGTLVLGAGKSKRVLRGAPAGSPDIMGVIPVRGFAALFGLEVKTATGRQAATQKLWQAKAEKVGVRYAVVRGVSEALRWIEKWGGEGER